MSADAKDKHLGAGGYALVWIVLLALTGLSYWASTLGLAGWEAPVALAIAVVKATLVVWFFMHLLEAGFAMRMVVLVSALFVLILVALMAGDVATRRTFPKGPDDIVRATESGGGD